MSGLRIGRVYKIIHNQSDLCYIGSTFNTLRDRFMKHKRSFNSYIDGNYTEIAIYPFFLEYGLKNFKIILIKEYQVCDKKHLYMYEALWINKLRNINRVVPFHPFSGKQYQKWYRGINKDKIKEYHKEYRGNNADKLSQLAKEYRGNNADKLSQLAKEYWRNNKEKLSQQAKENRKKLLAIECSCGSRFLSDFKNKHLKTKKHIKHINQIN